MKNLRVERGNYNFDFQENDFFYFEKFKGRIFRPSFKNFFYNLKQP
jgi:hypothetical protein